MIPLPQQPKLIKKENNKATFEIEALYPGYGQTIGNCLRRVLFSSLKGAAITQVKIKSAPHEFSTLPGVYEDVVMIMLNLKKIRVKMHGDEPQTATLKVKGEKQIKASDFKLPPQLEIINKDLLIASLTSSKANLEMEIKVEKGIGYEPVEKRKKEKQEIGAILLDAIYTPIKKVAFKTEKMRVGERIDFDRLILEIETDGTISPEQALAHCCDILINHFSLFLQVFSTEEKPKVKEEKKSKKEVKVEKKTENLSEIKLEDFGLSTRVVNVLADNRIKSAASLVKKTEQDILGLEGMGEAGLKEIKKALKKKGFGLKEKEKTL